MTVITDDHGPGRRGDAGRTHDRDMILYESAVCEHGRKEVFGGTHFRNFYVHYKLKDWKYVG